LVWFGVPLLATQATYQLSGVCPNLFVYNVKIYSHFLLAKLASLTAIRHSCDSMPGKQAENIFADRHFPAVNRHGKQSEGLPAGTYWSKVQVRKLSGKN